MARHGENRRDHESFVQPHAASIDSHPRILTRGVKDRSTDRRENKVTDACMNSSELAAQLKEYTQ